jgi:hypothetical protein
MDKENLQNYCAGKDLAALLGLLLEDSRGVEKRRSGGSLPVAYWLGFRFAASVRFDVALFPLPAHRTGQAHFAHPALGERFTVSPTESYSSAG